MLTVVPRFLKRISEDQGSSGEERRAAKRCSTSGRLPRKTRKSLSGVVRITSEASASSPRQNISGYRQKNISSQNYRRTQGRYERPFRLHSHSKKNFSFPISPLRCFLGIGNQHDEVRFSLGTRQQQNQKRAFSGCSSRSMVRPCEVENILGSPFLVSHDFILSKIQVVRDNDYIVRLELEDFLARSDSEISSALHNLLLYDDRPWECIHFMDDAMVHGLTTHRCWLEKKRNYVLK